MSAEYFAPLPCPECAEGQIVICPQCFDYKEVYSPIVTQSNLLTQEFVRQAERESAFFWAWAHIYREGDTERPFWPRYADILLENPHTPPYMLRVIHQTTGQSNARLDAVYQDLEDGAKAIAFFSRYRGPTRDTTRHFSLQSRTAIAFASYEKIDDGALAEICKLIWDSHDWAPDINVLVALYGNPNLGYEVIARALDNSAIGNYRSRFSFSADGRSKLQNAIFRNPALRRLGDPEVELVYCPAFVWIMNALYRAVEQSCALAVDPLCAILQNPSIDEEAVETAAKKIREMDPCHMRLAVYQALLQNPVTQLLLLEDPKFATILHIQDLEPPGRALTGSD